MQILTLGNLCSIGIADVGGVLLDILLPDFWPPLATSQGEEGFKKYKTKPVDREVSAH